MSSNYIGDHALVMGGSMAGLFTARILADHFARVTLVERDQFPEQPQQRPGVPQSSHTHILLLKGQQILEQLFPGLQSELIARGATEVDWINQGLMLSPSGWQPRFPSEFQTVPCSRPLLEWVIYQRLKTIPNIKIIENAQVKSLLTQAEIHKITGATIQFKDSNHSQELSTDLIVDASGRQSKLPQWLKELGYPTPPETVINSFLGYASRCYQQPQEFKADWKSIYILAKPPFDKRGGLICPIENKRWIVTLVGSNRDYPPPDETGFLDFARSLRSPLLYEAIKTAQPLTPIYTYRGTGNHRRYYEQLSNLPDGLIAIGDAVCTFNPVYGQGMTVAALGALTLDQCLREHYPQTQFPQQFYRQLAKVVNQPWLMATGEDFRWPATEGGKPNGITKLLHQYLDQILALAVKHPKIYQSFAEVMHMTKPAHTLFHPEYIFRVLGQWIVSQEAQEIAVEDQPIPKLLSESRGSR